MKIILDTHIFLWAISDPDKISSDKVREIRSQANTVFISSISIAEIMIKSSLGKLKLNFDPLELIDKSGFENLSFTAKDACILKTLPYFHKDPFDRMLISQSIANKYHIISDDSKFLKYGCRIL